jgi:UrcA family protein
MKTTIISAALLQPALLLQVPPRLKTPARSMAVAYADLDLASEAGRRTLDLRIAHAVNAACGEASPANLRGQSGVRACRAASMAQARAQREAMVATLRRSGSAALAAR